MKIAVVGSGYVGLCSAAGFASLGHDVVCVDMDKDKVDKINRGEPPMYEEGLSELLSETLKNKKICASAGMESIKSADFIFITVGTPSKPDGNLDLGYVQKASEDVGNFLKIRGYCTIVVKSTVLPGTAENSIIPTVERIAGKKAGKDFGVCSNPEFFREGKALEDFFKPDRIIIGQYDDKSGDMLAKLYSSFQCPLKRTDLKTAELIKYASNAFLAMKISFINEIGNICKNLGIDVYEVAEGMGLDRRIGGRFLQAGIGFGGSCFGKDVSALLHKSQELNSRSQILEAVLSVNSKQPTRIVLLLKEKMDIRNKAIALLGLSFKEDTDDVRDAPSIAIISELLKHGCTINCYDPRAAENMRKIFPSLNYGSSALEALNSADACLILTGWKEFNNLSDKDFSVMKGKVIIEGRKILDRNKVSNYEGICW